MRYSVQKKESSKESMKGKGKEQVAGKIWATIDPS